MKVLINESIGGFGLSAFGIQKLCELQGRELYLYFDTSNKESECLKIVDFEDDYFSIVCSTKDRGYSFTIEEVGDVDEYDTLIHAMDIYNDISRNDANLTQVFETYGQRIADEHCVLKIVDVPDDVDWVIGECYDGREYVTERCRSWS